MNLNELIKRLEEIRDSRPGEDFPVEISTGNNVYECDDFQLMLIDIGIVGKTYEAIVIYTGEEINEED